MVLTLETGNIAGEENHMLQPTINFPLYQQKLKSIEINIL